MDYFRAMALLTVKNISKTINGNVAVKQAGFVQHSSEKIGIAGETGSGKSTLLKMIAGIEQPDAGEINFDGKKITGPDDQLIPGHPHIAYLSQYFELRHYMYVHEIMGYANELREEEAKKLYTICRIEHLFNRRTDQLSGGEAQRIALARLLTTKPTLLLLDEPFSNLDFNHKNIIKEVIKDIGDKLNTSCILVSHDAPDILSWADKILVMKTGEIIQEGSPVQIYQQPLTEYCAGLFGDYNLINEKTTLALYELPGLKKNGKKAMIRPEQFKLSTNKKNGVKVVVENVIFRGSHDAVDVLIDKKRIRVMAKSSVFKNGETIYLSLPAGDVWYI